MVNTDTIKRIENNLKTMKLPIHRKSIRGGDSIKWLIKNLAFANSEHSKYQETMDLLKTL